MTALIDHDHAMVCAKRTDVGRPRVSTAAPETVNEEQGLPGAFNGVMNAGTIGANRLR
jgi:hypothetical protein